MEREELSAKDEFSESLASSLLSGAFALFILVSQMIFKAIVDSLTKFPLISGLYPEGFSFLGDLGKLRLPTGTSSIVGLGGFVVLDG